MTKVLTGKIALVTGGARGIGAGIARALAKDGADVAISYSASEDKANALAHELEGHGVRAIALRADQGDLTQAAALVGRVVDQLGALDILVNNAGVAAYGPITEQVDAAQVARLFAVNLHGVVATTRAAVARMREGGRIINIGSTLGHDVPMPNLGDYAASKAALDAYTRSWARELGTRRITVNLVNPGPIDTDMNPVDGPFSEYVTKTTALGRYGTTAELGAVIAFLVSPSASYVTGASLDVDGGQSA
jgi:3-oxoacyl-[acyl-carrier protein] reductase